MVLLATQAKFGLAFSVNDSARRFEFVPLYKVHPAPGAAIGNMQAQRKPTGKLTQHKCLVAV